ncbi:MAG: hypothetical protein H7338_11735, partial [Candidatus Sericytochromatia bacterium]|nr:hypothetical protein [Candidatus Sericytochromatia bacterium]
MRIAFYHKVSRVWDGRTADGEPLGGTQTAIIGLTRALAALGHDVLVFGTPAAPIVCDGVSYHGASALPTVLRQAPIDVLVSVVNTELFRLGIKAPLNLFWSHNDYRHFLEGEAADLHATLAEDLARRAHKVIAVSDWHADLLRQVFQLPADHVWATRNGVAPADLPARP